MMDATLLGLQLAVLLAALLQAATGIGFGVIAGPIILMAMNSGSAIQVSILLSLLIAAVLAPMLFRKVDRVLLARFLLGTLLGLPVGIFVFLSVSVEVLKILAGLSVLFMAVSASGLCATSRDGVEGRRGRLLDYGVGLLSGAMCTSLAMPGPVAAARLSALGRAKDTIRATVLVMFVFSYLAALAVQAGFAGIARETWTFTATLAPATLIGVLVGKLLAARISERVFRWLIVAVLAATSVSLLATSIGRIFGVF
jgi:uncharacterized membrane protein YfcA